LDNENLPIQSEVDPNEDVLWWLLPEEVFSMMSKL